MSASIIAIGMIGLLIFFAGCYCHLLVSGEKTKKINPFGEDQ